MTPKACPTRPGPEAATSASRHHLCAIQRVHRSNENGSRLPLDIRHDIEAPVNPLAEIHIGEACGAEHDSVSAGAPALGSRMGGRIGQAQIGLDLNDDSLGSLSIDRRDQPCSEKLWGDDLCRSSKEGAAERRTGRRPHPPLRGFRGRRPDCQPAGAVSRSRCRIPTIPHGSYGESDVPRPGLAA